jgi:hypothetical protein
MRSRQAQHSTGDQRAFHHPSFHFDHLLVGHRSASWRGAVASATVHVGAKAADLQKEFDI